MKKLFKYLTGKFLILYESVCLHQSILICF